MKCSKCNNEMRLSFNPQTKQQIGTCDNCNYSINVYTNTNTKKKISILSIVALFFHSFVAFHLSV